MTATLLNLKLKNFCCIGSAELPLADQGLAFISGDNQDTDAADSNGAGKSTLWKGLTWTLFEQCIDGDRADAIIRRGQEQASGSVTIEDHGGGIWEVLRVRRKGSTTLQLSDHKGRKVPGSRAELQTRIEELIGVDFHAFRNTSLYGQNDTFRFADPRTKDSERKAMLHKLLRTTVFAGCHDHVRKEARRVKGDIDEQVAHVDSIEARLDECAIDDLREESEAWEAERERKVDDCLARAKSCRDEAKALREHAASADDLRAELEKLAAATEVCTKAAAQAKELRAKASEARSKAHATELKAEKLAREEEGLNAEAVVHEDQLDLLKGDRCPTCTSPLDAGAGAKHKADLVAKVKELEKAARVKRKKRTALMEEAGTYEGEAARHEADAEGFDDIASAMPSAELLAELQAGLALAERAEDDVAEHVARAKEYLAQAKALKAEDNPHAKRYVEIAERTAELEELKGKAEATLATLHEQLAHVEFWVKGFSGQGLPSFVLDSTMPFLTERTNRYLEVLADGDITVHFSTQRELKSKAGELRDEIEIAYRIEGHDEVKPSGGQLKKIEIAVDIALMDLAASREGAGVDFLALDEVLDGLDREGRGRVLELLQELRKVRGSVFVTSHEQDVSEVFEKALQVVKRDGVAAVEVR